MKTRPWILTAALLAAAGVSRAEYGPSGPEVVVDDSATGFTHAAAAGGGFVVVRRQSAGDVAQLVAQRTDGSGTPVGDPFVVAEGPDADNGISEGPRLHGIAGGPAGEFQVVWLDYQYYGPLDLHLTGVDPSDAVAFELLLDRANGPPDAVRVFGSDPQRGADGGFVVSWVDQDLDIGEFPKARRFAADGSPLTGTVELTDGPIFLIRPPSAAPAADGSFVAVWQLGFTGSSIRSLYVAPDGSTPFPEIEVSDGLPAMDPAVAAAANGELLVVWESDGSAGDDVGSTSVQGRRLGVDGTLLGAPFQVNSFTSGDQAGPEVVAVGPAGDFLVVWESDGSAGSDGDGRSVQGRRVAPDDGFSAPDFQVNHHATGDQHRARIHGRGVDEAVVVWRSDQPGSDEIRARAVADPLFADGFESGNTSAWSVSVP